MRTCPKIDCAERETRHEIGSPRCSYILGIHILDPDPESGPPIELTFEEQMEAIDWVNKEPQYIGEPFAHAHCIIQVTFDHKEPALPPTRRAV